VTQEKAIPVLGSDSYFDRVAQEYASWYYAQCPGGYAMNVRQQRVLELLDRKGGKVLDVGCGPGVITQKLLDLGYEFWGVDTSKGMIEQCHQHFEKSDRAHFTVGDATSLPFPDKFFDTAICTGVIDRIRADESALKEMLRVVKTNGTLLISFPNFFSPYATWKKFVFYPTVALLRPIYYGLARHPQPPSLPVAFTKVYRMKKAADLITKYGAEVTDIVYFNFNLFLSPLDELFPHWTMEVTKKLEPLSGGNLKWLGAAFLLKAKKR